MDKITQEKGMNISKYVYEVFNTSEGLLKKIVKTKTAYMNVVLFEYGGTTSKSNIEEITDWISIDKIIPDKEVVALGYQDEIHIGYIEETKCEDEYQLLEDVTHWKPKPLTLKERVYLFNDDRNYSVQNAYGGGGKK